MKKTINKSMLALTLGASLFSHVAFGGGEAGPLELRDFGSKFIAYTTDPQENGTLNVLNPMFVQYLLPEDRNHEYPVVFIHGGGGQGTDWMETPDGRDGWTDYFVADGWDVYVIDRPGHGRSQSNPSCAADVMSVGGFANTGIISFLSTSDTDVWPGGDPTPTNDAVVGWAASSATAPYCGNEIAAEAISALLDEIGPAILIAHSAGGGSTFMVPDLNHENIVGIIAFEAAGGNPVSTQGGPGGQSTPPAMANWETSPALPANFSPVMQNGCPMQGNNPSQLVNFQDFPLTLVVSERGLGGGSSQAVDCQVAAWRQAGVDATGVYMPDRGLRGGGHFAMAQLDTADYAELFIELAEDIEDSSSK